MRLLPRCKQFRVRLELTCHNDRSSLKYRLLDHLRLHPAQALPLRASVHTQADILESFIGGLYTERGLEEVKRWLDPLFRPYAESAYKLVREEYSLLPSSVLCDTPPSPSSSNLEPPDTLIASQTTGHLALFNQELSKSGDRQVEWIYFNSPDKPVGNEEDKCPYEISSKGIAVWQVKVLVDGECFGQGKGNTKRSARDEAAKVGLSKMGIHV